jgi:hypothetical protein
MVEPYCLAMVLCDAVHRDGATGKCTLLGTFSTVASRDYPTDIEFSVYFAITDGNGPTKVTFRFVDAKSGIAPNDSSSELSCEPPGGIDLNLKSPLVVVEGTIHVKIRLPLPGLYHCELYAGDELLMSRRLLAMSMPKPEGDADE